MEKTPPTTRKRSVFGAAVLCLVATAALAANWVGECTHPDHRYHGGATNDRKQAQAWVDNHNRQFPSHSGYTRVRPW